MSFIVKIPQNKKFCEKQISFILLVKLRTLNPYRASYAYITKTTSLRGA